MSDAVEILARLLQVDEADQLDVLATVVAAWVYRCDRQVEQQ